MDNLKEQVDMNDGIGHFIEPLKRLLLPAPGRHCFPKPPSPMSSVDAPIGPLQRVPVLRGDDIGLVRPCLAAFERRQEERRQRRRRRALWLTVHGVVMTA
ncbi:hypothetical protein AB0I66_00200 [Streptomyces sp. NPDC050439]|uniref:hypothetical protein n=1 Tax=unclassified Streptomyces TaxID=2593676 RepID=UPI003419E488